MEQKWRPLALFWPCWRQGWTFSMAGQREMGHLKLRRGTPLIFAQWINHLATPQPPMCGSLECSPGDPVKEPVFHTQHLQTLLPLVVQQFKVNTKSASWNNDISSRSPGVKSENNLFPLDYSSPLFWAGSLSCIWIKTHKSLSDTKKSSGNVTSLNINLIQWCNKLKFHYYMLRLRHAWESGAAVSFPFLASHSHTWTATHSGAGVPRSWIFQKSSLLLQAFFRPSM